VDSDLGAIDAWLTAPFHAIGMLRAQLTQVAFAEDTAAGYAGLDIDSGLDFSRPAATSPILYPGRGATTTLPMASDEESPDPLETCGWQGMQVGLPLIALLTQAPAAGLTASLSGPSAAESTADGDLCVVDENTYHTSDPVYGPTGLSILQSDHAVLLIPRAPLADGAYSVDIQQPGQPDITWAFNADIPPPATLAVPAIGGWYEVGAQLSAYNGQWTNDPTTFADQWLRCDASGASCSPIAGADDSTYVPTSDDGGETIRLQVTAGNSGGPGTPALSAPTSAIVDPGSVPSSPTGGLLPVTGNPGDASPGSGTSRAPTTGSKPGSCSLCVSSARPAAMLLPGSVAPHHSFMLTVAGRQAFTLKLDISTSSGHHLLGVTRHRPAGRSTIRISLPGAATGRGKQVIITAHVTIGDRHLTLRGAVRFR
jgi:hypothetical protein